MAVVATMEGNSPKEELENIQLSEWNKKISKGMNIFTKYNNIIPKR